MPKNLENIQPPKGAKDVPKSPDPHTSQEEYANTREWQEAFLEDFRQDIKERKKYANRIYCLVVFWLIGIALLLVWFGDTVNGGVLIALLSGTTVNVLGIFVVVAKYLFPQRKNHIECLYALEKEEARKESGRTREAASGPK